jgi:stage II sporulation protein M
MSYRAWLIVVVCLFTLGIAWGLSTPRGSPGAFSAETTALQSLVDLIGKLPVGVMFAFILLKNITAVLFSFVLSPLLLVVPIASLVMNGWLIGAVANSVVAERSLGYLLAGLLPHGVIELPALFIGEAAALSFGVAAMRAAFDRSRRDDLSLALRSNLKYVGLAAGLFLPAALIETFLTPHLLGR